MAYKYFWARFISLRNVLFDLFLNVLSALIIDHVVYTGNTATRLLFTEVVYLSGRKKGQFYVSQKIKRLPSCQSPSCERNLQCMVIDDLQAQFKHLNQIAVGACCQSSFPSAGDYQ